MIDYTEAAGFPKHLAKGRPKALDQDAKRAALEAKDRAENAKARIRAAGCCEVRMGNERNWVRCMKPDAHTHHLISGSGRRNVGASVLALWKIRVCRSCHADIHAKILQPTAADADARAIRFRRMR